MPLKSLLGWLHRHWFWVMVVLTATTTLVWSLHYYAQAQAQQAPLHWAAALHKGLFAALQFIVLNKELDDALPLWQWAVLSATQLLTPLFASLTLIAALFREHLEPVWLGRELALQPQDSFWLLVSPLSMSPGLVDALQASGHKVLVIDPADTSVQRVGNWYVQRDLQSPQVFRGLPIHLAQAVVLALPDEELNLHLLKQLQARLQQKPSVQPLKVHCRIQSHALLQLFMDQPGLDIAHSPLLDVRPLHGPMVCARAVLQRPACIPVHQGDIAIVGTSALAQALVLRLARMGIATPDRPLQILWAGEGSAQALTDLVHSYASLSDALHTSADGLPALALPHLQVKVHETTISAWLQQQGTHLTKAQTWPEVIYVAHDSSAQTLLDARLLQIHGGLQDRQQPQSRIVALVATSLLQPAPLPVPTLHWHCTIEVVQPDTLLCEHLVHDLADAMAQSYDALWSQATRIDMASWRNLSFAVKETNRDIADHLPWKLAYAGLNRKDIGQLMAPCSPLSEELRKRLHDRLQNDEVLQALIRMEQLRYRAFMRLQGFRPSTEEAIWPDVLPARESKQLERALRINPTLGIALEALSPEEVDKDRNIIVHTSAIIDMAKQSQRQSTSGSEV
ncbi:MAG: hypothetical protein RSD05_09775 [Comamonas sp.]